MPVPLQSVEDECQCGFVGARPRAAWYVAVERDRHDLDAGAGADTELHIAGQLVLSLAQVREAWSVPLRAVFAG